MKAHHSTSTPPRFRRAIPVSPQPASAASWRHTRVAFVAALGFGLSGFSSAARAADGIWINGASNSPWGATANWSSNTVANGPDAIADFSTLNLTATRTINLNAAWTAGALLFGDTTPSNNWVLANGTGGPWTLTLASTGTPPVVTVVNQTTTISAALGGTQGLSKAGTGTLVLTGVNSLTGGIGIAQGALSFADGSLGANLVTFGADSALVWNGTNTQDASAQLRIADGVTATVNTGANNVSFASSLQTGGAASGALTKTGAGTLTIAAANTFTGSTKIAAGRLVLAGGSQRLAGGALSLGQGTGGGILQLGDASGASDQTLSGLALVGTGTANAIVGGNASVSTLTLNNATGSTFAGFLGGTGTNEDNLSLSKSGAGALTLGGANSFVGAVTLTGGALILTQSSALGSGAKTITISGTTNAPSLQLNAATALTLPASYRLVTSNDSVTAPAILNTAGDNVIAASIAPSSGGFGGTQTRISVNGGSLTITGDISPDVGAASARTVILDGSATGTISGLLSNNGATALGVTKAGTGTWTLTAANTFTGATTISAGRLAVASILANGSPQPLGSATTALTLGNATTTGTLDYSGTVDATLGRPITVGGAAGGIVRNSGGALLTLSATLTRSGRPLTFTGGAFNVPARITGTTTGGDFTIAGATVTLANSTNNYDGPTTVTGGGILSNGAAEVVPNTSLLTLGESSGNTGGTYDLNGFDETLGGLASAGSGSKTVTNSGATGGQILTLAGAGSYDGRLTDGPTARLGLAKTTAGVQTLSGASNYTGPTTVTGGTLAVSGRISGSVAISISGGTLLLGASDVFNDAASLEFGGGTFQTAGFSEGTGAVAGLASLILSASSSLDFGEGASVLHFTSLGNVTAGAALAISQWNAGIDHLLFTGDETARGAFALPQGAISFNGQAGYAAVAFDTQTFEIIAIPEPGSTSLLGVAGLLGVVGFRERERLSRRRLRAHFPQMH